jgi:hypothetical protein
MVRLKVLYVHRRPHCTTRGRAQQTQAVWRPAAQASLSAWSIVPEGGPHGIARISIRSQKGIGPQRAFHALGTYHKYLHAHQIAVQHKSACLYISVKRSVSNVGEPTQVLLRCQ